MRIESFELHRIQIPFTTAFKHARSERVGTDAIIVELRCDAGGSGFGEILPREYVTGETIESVLERTGETVGARFLGQEFSSKDDVIQFLTSEIERAGRDLATFAGFELALLDLAGTSLGFALGDVLGGEEGPALPAGVVIGFEVETAALPRYCAVLRLKRKRHIKVKVGREDDRERLRIISRAVDVPLRLDANGAWPSADAAVDALRALAPIAIASVEQPLHPDDVEGARYIREHTGLAVMADEAVCSLEDAERLIQARAADIFNIRLGKCGGVLGSRRIVERAWANGLTCHLGTLVGETGILTRAAEIFGRFVPGFECLDGKRQNESLLTGDILTDPRDAARASTSAPGLGVCVSTQRIRQYLVDADV